MWVWWNRFLLNQEMQDMNHHYISHWCLPHILVSPDTPPLVHVGGTAASLLHWGEGPPSAPCQSDLSRHHLWKVNITTCHALSELWTQQTHSAAHNDIHYPSPHTTTVASGTQWQSYSCRVTPHKHCTKWTPLVQMRMLSQCHWCTPTLTTCMNLPLTDPYLTPDLVGHPIECVHAIHQSLCALHSHHSFWSCQRGPQPVSNFPYLHSQFQRMWMTLWE